MSRTHSPIELRGALVCAGLALVALAAAPGTAGASPREPVIVLPGASSTEGIAVGRGSTFFAGDLFGGDIFRGDLQHGTVERLVDAPAGRMAVGMKADDPSGLLFVSGGLTGQAYVYDTDSGATVATYQLGAPGSSFINDVVVTRDAAWFTDSQAAVLHAVPVGPGGALGDVRSLAVTGPAADLSGAFNLNGIAATPDGRTLIVGHSATNALYSVDPATGASALVMSITGPDGLLVAAGRLYVAQAFLNQVAEVALAPDLSGGTVVQVITSDHYQIPTTVAVHGNTLATVNAKFDTGLPPTAGQYEVVLVSR
jgi:sugar lactone lactonase YvrE